MHTEQRTTAILIFANSSQKEHSHKSFAKHSPLFEVLNQQTVQKVKRSGLPYFHFTENEQMGNSFGERFVNAIQAVYDKGFKNVITIGNDSPQLKTAHLLKANAQLAKGKTVLGPSTDGGFYLMGLHKDNFDTNLFQRLPWQRFSLFRRISLLLKASRSELFQLPVLHDIDTREDIVVMLNYINSVSNKVLQIFRRIVQKLSASSARDVNLYAFLFTRLTLNKGSPNTLYFLITTKGL
ncbi:DUF2064 domain-containing protein [uncultured Croceitalea sp.]|uniref:DUF2064 domain-containing protein n=1 Tax=uncultured Croceitalea sp. TaxID=1798908 RepID=UPI0033061A1E